MKPKLSVIMEDTNGKYQLQYDEQTDELYVNNKKILYEIGLTKFQKFLAIGVSLSIIAEAIMSMVMSFIKFFKNC
jgi:hypothetical protein